MFNSILAFLYCRKDDAVADTPEEELFCCPLTKRRDLVAGTIYQFIADHNDGKLSPLVSPVSSDSSDSRWERHPLLLSETDTGSSDDDELDREIEEAERIVSSFSP